MFNVFPNGIWVLSYHLAMKPQASLESLWSSDVVIYESKVLILNGTAYLFHNKMITCLMYFQTRFGYLSYHIGLKQASCITCYNSIFALLYTVLTNGMLCLFVCLI